MAELTVIKSPWFDDFPALNTQVYEKRLRYLDTAATAQTPNAVIDRMTRFRLDISKRYNDLSL